ncbi:galactose/methyl galactoside import ATP-binding protein MglA [Lachnospiraceae bacterium]|mgnify:CR=1 FL=1|jgi:simple sugar transport system ATP-binding protein|nr:ABC transporter ATP-binding protein [Lachnospiraceae bacterium]GFI15601.1 galactose/methyl galactoside import ATP-binding protein MglA [Lachnospiraceae bacterium]GFI69074.1 galactose/methyl galactoside import ATP-binding protein MglA [Lachnospiraceae bacterium]
MNEDLLVMSKITKIYPNGVMANDKVDFSVKAGEIHALMGENGAGKSTLMNILYGEHQPEEGAVYLEGRKIKITSPNDAIAHGIGMVHQHFMLVPSLSVAQNIYLGKEPRKNGLIDTKMMIKQAEEIAEKYNFKILCTARVADIPVGMKQKVEILKALAGGAKILILDEPTAVLTPQETEELFHELTEFKKRGHTIIFISHKLKEIKQICDRITIMKNGKSMGTYDMQELDEKSISRLMVGRDVIKSVEKRKAKPGDAVLKVEDLSCINEDGKHAVNHINLKVRKGEILGIAGVEGNGQSEFVECISGMRKDYKGRVSICGQYVDKFSIKKIRKAGLSHISEDRMSYGVATEASISDNLISDKLGEDMIGHGPILSNKKIAALALELVDKFLIKCSSYKQPVSMLSGGNMQKVVIAREFAREPAIMIANQPSRGVDVGATEFIHKKLVEIRDNGAAVLLVSADLNEVMELSDSLAVFYGGEVVAYFEDSRNVTEEELGYYMLGLMKQPEDIILKLG